MLLARKKEEQLAGVGELVGTKGALLVEAGQGGLLGCVWFVRVRRFFVAKLT